MDPTITSEELTTLTDERLELDEILNSGVDKSPHATKNNASKEGISNFMTGRFLE
jgi:hypothetical protein